MCCKKYQLLLGGENNCYSNRKSLSEHGCKLLIETRDNSEICTIKVDGCIISDSPIPKCDFAISPCNNAASTFYFVELKGSDYSHAYEQIISTINYFRNRISELE